MSKFVIRWSGKTCFADGTASRYTMWLHLRGGLVWCNKRTDAKVFDTVAEARAAFNDHVNLIGRPANEHYEIVEVGS